MIEWTEKYRPKTLKEVVGNDAAIKELREWGAGWGSDKKAVILYGGAGIGKTSAAHALAYEFGWDVIELNASDERTASAIKKVAGSASQNRAFDGMRLIILDEADNLHGNADRGGARAITGVIKRTAQPIILIANEYYDMTRELRNLCKSIQFRQVQKSAVAPILITICRKEGVEIEDGAISEITANSGGDLRSAINDLQAISLGRRSVTKEDVVIAMRDRRESIFNVLNKIFDGWEMQEALDAVYGLDETPEDLIRWLDENLPIGYDDASIGFQNLSRADIFLGRTKKRQNYTLWRYANALMVCGVLAAKPRGRNSRFRARYQPPSTFRRLAQTRSKRNLRGSLAAKIGENSHVSRTYAYQLIALYQIFCKRKKDATAIAAKLNLSIDEIAMLLDSKKNSKKVIEVFDDAQELVEEEEVEFFRSEAKKPQEQHKPKEERSIEKTQQTLFDF
ncbi:MAG: replication factor C large subunit [Halobacteriota archaeon]|nr:replication factor C large subunit [Halobacteriota archaeon]